MVLYNRLNESVKCKLKEKSFTADGGDTSFYRRLLKVAQTSASAHWKDRGSFQPVTFGLPLICLSSSLHYQNSQSLAAQVQLDLTGWSMGTDNDLTLGPMSIRKCLGAQSESLQLTELYACPWVRCLAYVTLSARSVGQRVDPERKTHNSRYKNALPEEMNPPGSSYGR